MKNRLCQSCSRQTAPFVAAFAAALISSGVEAQTFIPVPQPVYEAPNVSSPPSRNTSSGNSVPSKPSPKKPQLADQKLIPCPNYGPGFFRQPGSMTCLKASGQVRIETGIGERRSRLVPVTGSSVRAGLGLDTRTATEFGTLRTVVVTRGLVSNGNIVPSR